VIEWSLFVILLIFCLFVNSFDLLFDLSGDQYWQAHDIHSWQFNSLYEDENYTPPLSINNEGAYTCVNETACVNRVDYDHYMRKNNVWGPSADNTEGWQSGTEGYCAFC
jgi:hypothetical protein